MSSGKTSALFTLDNLTRERVIATRVRLASDSAALRRSLLDAPKPNCLSRCLTAKSVLEIKSLAEVWIEEDR